MAGPKPLVPVQENSPLDGIIDFSAGNSEEDHEAQPGLYVKRGDDPLEVSIASEPYPAPLRGGKPTYNVPGNTVSEQE